MDKHLDPDALSDYAEGLLEAAPRAAADRHLAGCADCRRELAAIQAYFRELSGLEPISAPADFLAKVRARLPSPSPWRRAWTAIATSLRAVPPPIAVAVILGVTVITVYLRQGGSESRAVIPPPPEPRAVPGPAASPAPKTSSAAPSKPAAPARSVPPIPPVPSARALSAPSVPASAVGGSPAAPASTASKPSSAAPHPLTREPAPASALRAPSAAPKSSAMEQAQTSNPAVSGGAATYSGQSEFFDRAGAAEEKAIPSASPPNDEVKPSEEHSAAKKGSLEGKASAPRRAEAESGRASDERKDEVAAEPDQRRDMPATEAFSGYALSLRSEADAAAVLSGLRAMGIAATPASAVADERRYRLLVPASMLRELGPYLARHGRTRLQGSLPSSPSGESVAIGLRLILATP